MTQTPEPSPLIPAAATPRAELSAPQTPGGAPPQTGDLVVDAALRDLAAAPMDDLDAHLEAGEHVHRTLQSRLADLGG